MTIESAVGFIRLLVLFIVLVCIGSIIIFLVKNTCLWYNFRRKLCVKVFLERCLTRNENVERRAFFLYLRRRKELVVHGR